MKFLWLILVTTLPDIFLMAEQMSWNFQNVLQIKKNLIQNKITLSQGGW